MRVLALFLAAMLSLSAQAVPLQGRGKEAGPADKLLPRPETALSAPAPEADRARAALGKGLWTEAYRESVKAMARRVPDVDALGALAVSATLLGEQTMREAALNRLLQAEDEPRYYHSLALGIADLAAKRTEAAGRRFDAILSRSPNEPLARYFRGRVLELGGKSMEALRDYQTALENGPDFAPALAAVASLRSSSGAHKEAVALMERAAAIEPSNLGYRKSLAEIYERAGQGDKAKTIYTELLKAVPGTMETMLNGAWNLLRSGRPADARKQVSDVTRLYGPQPLGHLLLAMAAADQRQYADIPPHVTDYLRAKKNTPAAVAAASLVYIALGDGKGAVRLYEAARAEQTDNVQAIVNLAVARHLAGQTEQARTLLGRAATAGESAELLAFLSANLDLARGDLAAYRAVLGKAEDFLPGIDALSAEAEGRLTAQQRAALAGWRNAAMLMLLNGWSTPMERLADRALAVAPNDAIALHIKGLALKASGRATEAAHLLRRAAQLEPGFLAVQLALADTLLTLRNVTEARAVLQRVEPLAQHGHALFKLAVLTQRSGNGGHARALMQKALQTADQGRWREQAQRILKQGTGR